MFILGRNDHHAVAAPSISGKADEYTVKMEEDEKKAKDAKAKKNAKKK